MPKEYKVQAVEELKEALKKSNNFYMTDYRGLTVEQLSNLRIKLREKDSKFKVVKNNFFMLACKEMGIDGLDKLVKGPIGVTFVSNDDPVTPAKILIDFAKDFRKQKLFRIIGGYFEGKAVEAKDVTQISNLPTKEVLLAQIMGCVQGPTRGIMTCLQGSIRGIMQCVKGIIEKNS